MQRSFHFGYVRFLFAQLRRRVFQPGGLRLRERQRIMQLCLDASDVCILFAKLSLGEFKLRRLRLHGRFHFLQVRFEANAQIVLFFQLTARRFQVRGGGLLDTFSIGKRGPRGLQFGFKGGGLGALLVQFVRRVLQLRRLRMHRRLRLLQFRLEIGDSRVLDLQLFFGEFQLRRRRL